jgi:protoheme IX farnesyltransferase
MLFYTLALFPVALAPMFLGAAGLVYGALALILNLGFVFHALRVLRERESQKPAKAMFGFSILYLFGHFAALVLDRAPGLVGMWNP